MEKTGRGSGGVGPLDSAAADVTGCIASVVDIDPLDSTVAGVAGCASSVAVVVLGVKLAAPAPTAAAAAAISRERGEVRAPERERIGFAFH